MVIIPSPIRVTSISGEEASYSLCGPVIVSFSGEGADGVAGYLCAHLNANLGLDTLAEAQEDAGTAPGPGPIWLCVQPELDSLAKLPNQREAYRLSITDSGIKIQARAAHGLFNGVQSLLQLLPPKGRQDVQLQQMQITDSPRFPWRGVLLDVGRHFFSVDFLKKVLDVMAFYKFNRFHWHLTEDQGWRLEVKRFPKLTEFGAWRGPRGRKYGGFYTQQEVREIVAYAAERFIEVIPEIELPGHCCAALACYPQLSCTGKMYEVPDFWGVQEDVYCAVAKDCFYVLLQSLHLVSKVVKLVAAHWRTVDLAEFCDYFDVQTKGKEEVFEFLECVLTEVMELFPSQYIHIGGDECPKTRWSCCSHCQRRMREEGLPDEYTLQSWFIGRINKFLLKRGKQLIGWDEILEGGLNPGTIVMSWRGITGGVRAAREGHQVIMTPTSHCYFDYRQSLRSDEPGAWFAMLPLEMVYDYDPTPPPPEYARQELAAARAAAEDDSSPNGPGPRVGGGLREGVDDMSDAEDAADKMSEDRREALQQTADAMSEEEEESGGKEPMPQSTTGTSNAEQGDLVFSTSMPAVFQGRPEDDWTLESRYTPLIIGGQANVWTEYIRDEETVEYMLLPRLCAMSEALWSPPQDRSWPSFLDRLKAQLPHLDARGFKYRPLS